MGEVKCRPEEPLLGAAIEYLKETHEVDSGVWVAVPTDANDYPHAIWWRDEEGSLARLFHDFGIIPRALILACLHSHRDLVSQDWLAELTEDCVHFIEAAPVEALRLDGFAYSVKLAEAPGLPAQAGDRLRRKLQGIVSEVVSTDPADWSHYCLPPLKAAPKPTSLAAPQLRTALEAHLDYTIGQKTDEGAWDPTWEWRTPYSESWATAKEEWRGNLTLQNLTWLRAYDRLEL